jgi:protein TonB
VLAILFWHLPNIQLPDRTEVTLVEAPAKKEAGPKMKAKNFVEETDTKPKDINDLKDTADFLSQFTKRVKKQLVARENGPTRNLKPEFIPVGKQAKEPGQKDGVAGMDQPTERTKERGDIGLPAPGGTQSMRQVAIGPSSIAEYIPGVEQGDFTALNTDQFTYYSFFSRINEQVRNRWVAGIRSYMDHLSMRDQQVLSQRDRQTVVEIILTRTGEFSSSVISQSSGDRTLDQTTIESFRNAAPFLNPPQGMVEDDGMIHLHYGFMVRFRPPLGQAG